LCGPPLKVTDALLPMVLPGLLAAWGKAGALASNASDMPPARMRVGFI
jgi:hypothetical protein